MYASVAGTAAVVPSLLKDHVQNFQDLPKEKASRDLVSGAKEAKDSDFSPALRIHIVTYTPEPSICTLWDEHGDDHCNDMNFGHDTTQDCEEASESRSGGKHTGHSHDMTTQDSNGQDFGTGDASDTSNTESRTSSDKRTASESRTSPDGVTEFTCFAQYFANRFSLQLSDECLQELLRERKTWQRSHQNIVNGLRDEILDLRAELEQEKAALYQAKSALSRLYSQNMSLARAAGKAQQRLQAEKSKSPPPSPITQIAQPERKTLRRSLGVRWISPPQQNRALSEKPFTLDKNRALFNRTMLARRQGSPPSFEPASMSCKEEGDACVSDAVEDTYGAFVKQPVREVLASKHLEIIPEDTPLVMSEYV
eukprot:g12557.t1